MNTAPPALTGEGLDQFLRLQAAAVTFATERLYAARGDVLREFGQRGRDACQDGLHFMLEFLRSALEFGLLQPVVDYLNWARSVLRAQAIDGHCLSEVLDAFAEFYVGRLPPADALRLTATLRVVRDRALAQAHVPAPRPQPPSAWPEANTFKAALLTGSQRLSMAIVNDLLAAGHGLLDIELHVIQPALYAIGEGWQDNQITVAQEHLATAIVQSVMTVALLQAPPPTSNGKRVMLACVEGNRHAVGLRMVADAFQLAGWEVQYLGADVPTPSLIEQVAHWRPDLVGLSLAFPQHLQPAREFLTQLTERLGEHRPAIMVGGLVINRLDTLANAVGADAISTDAASAVRDAARLLPEIDA
jgi:methanogenic corrinoid protein MtbC1